MKKFLILINRFRLWVICNLIRDNKRDLKRLERRELKAEKRLMDLGYNLSEED